MTINSLKKFSWIPLAAIILQACGGRIAAPVLQYNALDQAFTCEHLKAEFNVNTLKFKALDQEEEQRNIENTTQLFFGSPLLLDLTSTLDKERAALQARNAQIKKLGVDKGCLPFEADLADKA